MKPHVKKVLKAYLANHHKEAKEIRPAAIKAMLKKVRQPDPLRELFTGLNPNQ